MIERIEEACSRVAIELDVRGLMNVQIAVKNDDFYIIEINPRASRTVPYISKATRVPLAKVAARVIMGESLADIGITRRRTDVSWCAVKEAVFPFNRFAGVDPILGPEMKSTGEVMGLDLNFEAAYWKSQIAAGQILPTQGTVFLSARDEDKDWIVDVGRDLIDLGFELAATAGTATALKDKGMKAQVLNKLADEQGTNVIDLMQQESLSLLINTPSGPVGRKDEIQIRSQAILRSIPIVTTEPGARATVNSIRYVLENGWDVRALQDYYLELDVPALS